MKHKNRVKQIVRVLIRNPFYFTFSVRERYDLIMDILQKFGQSRLTHE